jgi:restriction endonuclease S subunit
MSKVVQKKLCEISNIVMGQSPSSNSVFDDLGHGLPFLQGCAEFGRKFPNPFKSCSNGPKRAIKGSTLISVRAPVGDTNLADRDYIIGRGLASIEANGVDADYLSFAINFSKDNLQRVSQGSTFAAVGSKEINDLQIPLFERHEQYKIAQILSSIDKQIELTENLVEKKKLIKLSLVDEAVSTSMSSGFAEAMYDYCESVADGTHDTPTPLDEGVPLLTSKNLSEDGSIDLNDFYFISEKQAIEINKRSYVNPGDLLFGMIGTIGNPVICKDSFKFSVKNVAILRQGGNFLRAKWLFYILNSSLIKRNIFSMLDGSTQKFLSLSKVRALSIPSLSMLEMIKWVNILDSIHEEINLETHSLVKLRLQKQGLMQDLLTGRVRVNL